MSDNEARTLEQLNDDVSERAEETLDLVISLIQGNPFTRAVLGNVILESLAKIADACRRFDDAKILRNAPKTGDKR